MQKQLLLAALLLILKTVAAQRPISSEEAGAAAKRIEAATNSGDAGVLDHFIDLDSLIGIMQQKSQALKTRLSGAASRNLSRPVLPTMASRSLPRYGRVTTG